MVGFRIQNLDTIPPVYCCPRCLLLLRDPVQLTNCGHRQCQSCIDEQIGDVIICSECHEKISREELVSDRGFRNDMHTLPIICALCNWTDVLKNYQNHLNQNHPNPTCTYCNNRFPSVNDLYQHQQFICDKITVDCPLKPIGCDEQIHRIDFPKHYLSERHQRAIINFILLIYMKDIRRIPSATNSQLQEIHEPIGSLSIAIESLNDDLKRLDTEYIHSQNVLQTVIQRLPTLKQSIDDQNAFVDSLKPIQEIFEEDIRLATQKFNDTRLMSNDGLYIWKINNVQEKMFAAQSGAQPWIDSPPFYSSPTGYKMCLRLYLYGDDNARDTYASLYFVQMRGEFDAILKYPFCFKLIFCLYDQTNEKNHITHILSPNVRSNSYQRPQSEMIVAGGISEFVSLQKLQEKNNPYIRDDTMFIKTIIDFNNIKKDILPYAINLSPALAIQIQDEMIREETERQREM